MIEEKIAELEKMIEAPEQDNVTFLLFLDGLKSITSISIDDDVKGRVGLESGVFQTDRG